ncbi:hypothetical protein M23134_05674 [Microscilla marina ATCC 23134]|uniref:Uncharacterized protein n=1 Tax=Microscilla marina ATCC 23134 TaxID=313606 RepID=A1ZID4_MICM2|nr:hypothetical protein M23134_05674 [Microscilla marina ATCC 23134]
MAGILTQKYQVLIQAFQEIKNTRYCLKAYIGYSIQLLVLDTKILKYTNIE